MGKDTELYFRHVAFERQGGVIQVEVASRVGKFTKEVLVSDVGSYHHPCMPWTTQPIMGRACMVLGASPIL